MKTSPVGGLVDLEDRADVRMVDRRGGARLAHEALARLAVADQVAAEELDRNDPVEARVARLPDHDSTAARADLLDQLVASRAIGRRRSPSTSTNIGPRDRAARDVDRLRVCWVSVRRGAVEAKLQRLRPSG